jgi:hypothetical protein
MLGSRRKTANTTATTGTVRAMFRMSWVVAYVELARASLVTPSTLVGSDTSVLISPLTFVIVANSRL